MFGNLWLSYEERAEDLVAEPGLYDIIGQRHLTKVCELHPKP